MKKRMDSELLIELLTKRGFVLNEEKNRLEYGRGSISNYTKMTIYPPRKHYSLETDSEKDACLIQYESFSEPGYIECDWKRTEEGYVATDKLLDFLDQKQIKNIDKVKAEMEERRALLKAKRGELYVEQSSEQDFEEDLEY